MELACRSRRTCFSGSVRAATTPPNIANQRNIDVLAAIMLHFVSVAEKSFREVLLCDVAAVNADLNVGQTSQPMRVDHADVTLTMMSGLFPLENA
jgi:hypothetical protein